ncbi:AEC family transporter [Halocynthiibacter styelae]|uniref:AEC family transporter n=1 Tax=Halocynthiibacter styelae TaxID=2761955 RepID=A0A8J7IE44_9RHOB|nr:AEC family transporter [Paenihalocynthiibacter styelae]MBI1495148.1 AEC family transporter [Paenihalocynthiibacter styelae]
MIEIFLKTLPFFAIIGLGYGACRSGFFPEAAAAWLTKFVFYFALSAMLFGFAASLPVAEIFDVQFALAYLAGCFFVYIIATIAALIRKRGIEEAAVEAQVATIGNTGFLGVPMLVKLFGATAAGPVLMVLTLDLVVFSSLIVILITGARDGRMSPAIVGTLALGLLKNPMIVSIVAGLSVSAMGWTLPGPVAEFTDILGGAATPGALFAIGASLAGKSAERVSVAAWLSFLKLVIHPLAVYIAAFHIFDVDPFAAMVMVTAAALPVAGNVYILAQHYGVAPQRVSAAILISTVISVLTVTLTIAMLQG